MKLITLRNDFHNTQVRVRVEVMELPSCCVSTDLTRAQLERVKQSLCGVLDCKCGGLRGPQEFDGKKLIVGSGEMVL